MSSPEKELSQQMARIRGNVQNFQKMLSNMKPGPACESVQCMYVQSSSTVSSSRQTWQRVVVQEQFYTTDCDLHVAM